MASPPLHFLLELQARPRLMEQVVQRSLVHVTQDDVLAWVGEQQDKPWPGRSPGLRAAEVGLLKVMQQARCMALRRRLQIEGGASANGHAGYQGCAAEQG